MLLWRGTMIMTDININSRTDQNRVALVAVDRISPDACKQAASDYVLVAWSELCNSIMDQAKMPSFLST